MNSTLTDIGRDEVLRHFVPRNCLIVNEFWSFGRTSIVAQRNRPERLGSLMSTPSHEDNGELLPLQEWQMTSMAERMLNNYKTEEERTTGLRILESFSNHGNIYAMLHLGLLYELGTFGIECNKERALKLYKECKRLGNIEGSVRLAFLEAKESDITPANGPVWESLLYRLWHGSLTSCILSGHLSCFLHFNM